MLRKMVGAAGQYHAGPRVCQAPPLWGGAAGCTAWGTGCWRQAAKWGHVSASPSEQKMRASCAKHTQQIKLNEILQSRLGQGEGQGLLCERGKPFSLCKKGFLLLSSRSWTEAEEDPERLSPAQVSPAERQFGIPAGGGGGSPVHPCAKSAPPVACARILALNTVHELIL